VASSLNIDLTLRLVNSHIIICPITYFYALSFLSKSLASSFAGGVLSK